MATLSVNYPTLLDVARATGPDGKIMKLAELLAETNEVLMDMVWHEGNLATGHRGDVQTGIPSATWRKMYGYTQPSKPTSRNVTDTCGMLEQFAVVDKKAAEMNGNKGDWMMRQNRQYIEGMNQEFVNTLFYGNVATTPEEFTGFDPRFNDQSAENGENILTSAATPDGSDNTSIWLIVWGDHVHGIYPKGGQSGLQVGETTIETENDSNGGKRKVYQTHYTWDCGIHVADWRYIVRINYDLEDIVANGATGPVLDSLMRKALRRVPNLNAGRPAFYVNRDTLDALDDQGSNKSTLAFKTVEDAQGKLVNSFLNVPVRRCDAILSTESGL